MSKMILILVLGGVVVSLILMIVNPSPENSDDTDRTRADDTPPPEGHELATFGGGCFWCIEAAFEQLRGVDRVVSGYAGGQTRNPTYHQVCGGRTGHAEVVQIVFDPKVISYPELLDVFFTIHDPTTPNRQGPDRGTQYRSAIYYHSPEQKKAADEKIAELNAAGLWSDPIVTEVAALEKFYPAEGYHQQYFRKNPGDGYCIVNTNPKLAKLRKSFADKLKRSAD